MDAYLGIRCLLRERMVRSADFPTPPPPFPELGPLDGSAFPTVEFINPRNLRIQVDCGALLVTKA